MQLCRKTTDSLGILFDKVISYRNDDINEVDMYYGQLKSSYDEAIKLAITKINKFR
jgi:hypothetical protein